MFIKPFIITCLVGMIFILVGLWTGQNVNILPIEASANAPFYDQLFRVLLTVGTILFLTIFTLLIFSLIRFRRGENDGNDGLALESNFILEFVWTIVPAIIVLVIGLYSYDIYDQMGGMVPLSNAHNMHKSITTAGIKDLDVEEDLINETNNSLNKKIWGGIGLHRMSKEEKSTIVEVTAMQFAFIFKYPNENIVSGELHLPVGRPAELRMEAKDVIHAFWVPEFRLKQDIIPGQPTLLNFIPTRSGTYPIICAELCGPYHGGMRSQVIIDDSEVFEEWLIKNTPPTVAFKPSLPLS